MIEDKKYALLDTDFLYKSYLAQDAAHNTLADIVISFQEYKFFCHSMIFEELSKHDITPNPIPWLNELIQAGRVHIYSDIDILRELKQVYGSGASSMYLTMLEISCNTFSQNFFGQYYNALKALPNDVSDEVFLRELENCDATIPHQNGVGEKKTYVLIQMMDILHPGKVFLFCSDDFKARQSLNTIPGSISCLSILGVFQLLKEKAFEKERIKPFFVALCNFLNLQNQTTFRVWKRESRKQIPMLQVFDDIYGEKFILLRNGDLKYK